MAFLNKNNSVPVTISRTKGKGDKFDTKIGIENAYYQELVNSGVKWMACQGLNIVWLPTKHPAHKCMQLRPPAKKGGKSYSQLPDGEFGITEASVVPAKTFHAFTTARNQISVAFNKLEWLTPALFNPLPKVKTIATAQDKINAGFDPDTHWGVRVDFDALKKEFPVSPIQAAACEATNQRLAIFAQFGYETPAVETPAEYLERAMNNGYIWALSGDLTQMKMFSKDGSLVLAQTLAKAYDLMASLFAHGIVLGARSGDDMKATLHGKPVELKLLEVQPSMVQIGPRGGVYYSHIALDLEASDQKLATIWSAMKANFEVYGDTDVDHHNQDTIFVLRCAVHKTFIAAFVMTGAEIKKALRMGEIEQNDKATADNDQQKRSVKRVISLSKFFECGYMISSMIPHIGFERYFNTLFTKVAADQGLITDPQKVADAQHEWNMLGNPMNLEGL